MKIGPIVTIIVVIWFSSCGSKDIRLKEYYQTMNINYPEMREQFYFVQNYKGNTKSQKFVDSLICSSLPAVLGNYDKFRIHVFKYTKLANVSRLSTRPMLVEEGTWLTGDESARNDLIQRLEYWSRSGYHLFDYNLLFTCDTTYHKNR